MFSYQEQICQDQKGDTQALKKQSQDFEIFAAYRLRQKKIRSDFFQLVYNAHRSSKCLNENRYYKHYQAWHHLLPDDGFAESQGALQVFLYPKQSYYQTQLCNAARADE